MDYRIYIRKYVLDPLTISLSNTINALFPDSESYIGIQLKEGYLYTYGGMLCFSKNYTNMAPPIEAQNNILDAVSTFIPLHKVIHTAPSSQVWQILPALPTSKVHLLLSGEVSTNLSLEERIQIREQLAPLNTFIAQDKYYASLS